ncbi:MAG: hypothetical protein QOF02_392 [Blastocatellia bacterium]|nr:hypothetical protein [Blastocatellia bacterium]
MIELYALQRANGDWFAVKDQGRLRMPVFRSSSEAMQARARNMGMLLFKPVRLDESALDDITSDEGAACFWLVDNPSANLSRSRPIEHAQLVLLIQQPAMLAQAWA